MRIPYKFTPRAYQLPFLASIDRGMKRAFLFIHRRGGKDKVCVNFICKRAVEHIGIHYYFLPTATQARKVVWDNVDMMQHFPKGICKLNTTEMKVTFTNGSIVQFIGTDKYDSIRGTNPITCVFSEYAFQDPRVWDIIRPILNENGGVAVFQTTPNGDNHASELFELAKGNETWFTQMLDITQTRRDDGTPVITQEDIEEERKMGMSEEMIQQEYYCNTKMGKVGSYWGTQVGDALTQGRITPLPKVASVRVDIYSDLGISDQTSLWFVQKVGMSFHFINVVDDNGKGILHYADLVDNWLMENNLKLGVFHLPHDGKKRDFSSGVSAYDILMERYGGSHVKLVPISGKALQIDTARALFSRCCFDSKYCEYGIKALRNYHKKYDEKKKVFADYPDHDWSCHLSDSFQNFAMANKEVLIPIKEEITTINYNDIDINPLSNI